MKINQRLLICAIALATCPLLQPATSEAGGYFGLHFGSGGFGVSVGVGDWGVYTNAWSNPQWSPDFNSALAGYGEWVWIDGLGRCWRPWVASGWRPYTYGRWARTGANLTWIAYEPWGYFPHHYGNWAHASYGWVWVPGYNYASANVTWVRGGAHVGWYARPPHGWSHSARAFHHGYKHGYRDGWKDARYGTYVGWKHFASDNLSRHAVTHTAASKAHLRHGGAVPGSDELWRNGGSKLGDSRVSTRTVRMDGREVTLVRPEVGAASIERHAPGAVRNALSESALRQRQPRAATQRSTPRHNTRPAAVEGASRRSKVNDSRVRSPISAGQRTQTKATRSRPEYRSQPSPSYSSGTNARAKRTVSGRSGEVSRVGTTVRRARPAQGATAQRTLTTAASQSRKRRSPSGSGHTVQSTAKIRRPQPRSQAKKRETKLSRADSSKSRLEPPAASTRRR